ncbi:MAG TPA: hypothetical protein VNX68_10350 [Nitrosopumilaceae archaeon]|jgi:hypothetical protein|nr:hypothetical protein [Nitrosopumilaceae archaeon]
MILCTPVVPTICSRWDDTTDKECGAKAVFFLPNFGQFTCLKHCKESVEENYKDLKAQFEEAEQNLNIFKNYVREHPEEGIE